MLARNYKFEKKKLEKKKPGRWDKYKKPLIQALAIMLASLILWIIVVWALARCW